MWLLLSPEKAWPWNIQGVLDKPLFLMWLLSCKYWGPLHNSEYLRNGEHLVCIPLAGECLHTWQAEDAHPAALKTVKQLVSHHPSTVKIACKCTVEWWFSGPADTPSGISVEPHHRGYMPAQNRKAKTHISRLPLGLWQDSQHLKVGFAAWRTQWTDLQSWVWCVWEMFQNLKVGVLSSLFSNSYCNLGH